MHMKWVYYSLFGQLYPPHMLIKNAIEIVFLFNSQISIKINSIVMQIDKHFVIKRFEQFNTMNFIGNKLN